MRRRVIYIQLFLYGVGEMQLNELLYYICYVGGAHSWETREIGYIFLLPFISVFHGFFIFFYFTAGQIFAPFFFPQLYLLAFILFFSSTKRLHIFVPPQSRRICWTHSQTVQSTSLSTWNNQPTHLTTRELMKFIFQLLFFSSFFLLSCRKRMRVNSEDDVNLVNREQPLGKQTKSVQVHFEIDNLICISSSLQPSPPLPHPLNFSISLSALLIVSMSSQCASIVLTTKTISSILSLCVLMSWLMFCNLICISHKIHQIYKTNNQHISHTKSHL